MMELTKDQKKGLNLMGRILNKKYPYIIGALPNMKDFEDYSTLITIKLIISKSKLENHFNQKINTMWGNEFFRFSNLLYPNPDPESMITEEIKKLGNMFYTSLGDEFQFEKSLTFTTDFRTVKINSFILDDKN